MTSIMSFTMIFIMSFSVSFIASTSSEHRRTPHVTTAQHWRVLGFKALQEALRSRSEGSAKALRKVLRKVVLEVNPININIGYIIWP